MILPCLRSSADTGLLLLLMLSSAGDGDRSIAAAERGRFNVDEGVLRRGPVVAEAGRDVVVAAKNAGGVYFAIDDEVSEPVFGDDEDIRENACKVGKKSAVLTVAK
jgi:hypothetical protein